MVIEIKSIIPFTISKKYEMLKCNKTSSGLVCWKLQYTDEISTKCLNKYR